MQRKLQRISFAVALLTVMTACDKDKPSDSSNNTNPPPPPVDSTIVDSTIVDSTIVDSTMTTVCNSSNRPMVRAQLVPVGTLSQKRSGIAVAAVGNKILFAGGGVSIDTGTARVDIFDVVGNSWSTAELSLGRYGMASVTAGNKVFFAGGYWYSWDNGFYKPHATVDIYDAENNTWRVAQLSEPRGNLAAAAVGNKVFFAGGDIDIFSRASATVDIYDLSTGAWSTARLSEARTYLSAVTLDNKIYFAGGNAGSSPSNRIDIYDNTTNSWSTDTLKQPMGLLTGIAAANQIYWADGCNVEIKDIQIGNSAEAFLFRQGRWIGSFGQQAVLKDNKIVFYRHNLYDKADKFDIYDLTTQTWSIGAAGKECWETSIIAVNNTIYLAGGFINQSTHSDKVWKLEF